MTRRKRTRTYAQGPAPCGPTCARAAAPPVRAASNEGPAPTSLSNQDWIRAQGIRPKLVVSQPSDPEEQDADRAADAFVSGPQASPSMLGGGAIRPKLAISRTDDPDEMEAEAQAARFAAGERSSSVRVLAPVDADRVQRACADCEPPKEETPVLGMVRKAAEEGSDVGAVTAAPDVSSLSDTAGEPLANDIRADFERFFAADLSRVRVHTDRSAERTAAAIGALAFTRRTDIYFARGRFDPRGAEGRRLLAHELTHTLQREPATEGIRREPPTTTAPPAGATSTFIGPPVPTQGFTDFLFGLTVSESKDQVKAALRDEVGRSGRGGPDAFLIQVENFGGAQLDAARQFKKDFGSGDGVSGGVPESDSELARREKVRDLLLPVVKDAVADVNKESDEFLSDFEKVLRENTLATLDASLERTQTEQKRYGIESQTDVVFRSLAGGVTKTTYRVNDAKSPAVEGLKAAANVLIARRKKIDEQIAAMALDSLHTPDLPFLLPTQEVAAKVLKDMQDSYGLLLQYVSSEYPVLDRIGSLDRDTEGLKQIASGQEAAVGSTVGVQLEETRGNIEKSRAAVVGGDVNLWRLKEVVELTRLQTSTADIPFRQRLVKDKLEFEQPHILDAIVEGALLLLINVAAIALAAPTGGASLAVAFGVNAALAVKHTMDFLQARALAGSDLLRAQALSHEEPSFLWLAIEIIGVGLEAGPALAVFKKLVPLIRTAEIGARDGKIATEVVDAINAASRETGSSELGAKVLANVGKSSDAALVKLGVATEGELATLGKVANAVEKDAAATLGPGIRSAVGGEIKISKSGYLFSCRSPCVWLRERYIEIFNIDGEALASFIELEKRAQKLAGESAAAALEKDLVKRVQLTEKLNKEATSIERAASELEAAMHRKHPSLAGRLRDDAAAAELAIPEVAGLSPALAAKRRKILESLDSFVRNDSAFRNLKVHDPKVKIGVQGSVVRGTVGNPRKASFGKAFEPESFDLDVFVVSDSFPGTIKVVPLANARDRLIRGFPGVFDDVTVALKSGGSGLSVKVFRSGDVLPGPFILFE
ncbi:MAG: DUF4157 domain-containing protein [Caldimonas sp.]